MILWLLGALIVLSALAFAVTAARPPGCAACHHSHDFVAQTAASAHKSVECAQCHVPRGVTARMEYAYHVFFGAVGIVPVTGGPLSTVKDSQCLSCHEEVMKRDVTANGATIRHSVCAKGRMCVDCHNQTAHGSAISWPRTYSMNQCLECHGTARVRADCVMCHKKESYRSRNSSSEWAITHSSNWRQTHGLGNLNTCNGCHPDNYCARCHGINLPHGSGFIQAHPALALTNRKDCAVCHRPTFCDSCHGLEMPHPNSFTQKHSSLVKRQGKTLCLKCHIDSDCTDCHIKHVHPGGAIKAPNAGTN